MSGTIRIKRAYEAAASSDGVRVLVDRLWPRGLKRSEAQLSCWMKDVAPSPELRRWFDHRADRWVEFQRRYRRELNGSESFRQLEKLSASGDLTLLYAAKDRDHNHALVLAQLLRAIDQRP